jgi:dCMP deaminase
VHKWHLDYDSKWDRRFLDLAHHAAGWSKDPSTRVGAVAVRDRKILATCYNGLPEGIEDLHGRLHDREEKLAKHGVSLEHATIYVTPFIPCNTCCTLLIQTGIDRVVVPNLPIPDRWKRSFDLSRDMFFEAGVELTVDMFFEAGVELTVIDPLPDVQETCSES